jgi:uncharacterized protein (TIGR02147 family)
MTADQFHLVADWYHFALLSLVETRGFRSDAGWIARRLGIQKREARAALQRLTKAGMLRRTVTAGKVAYALTGNRFTTSDGVISIPLRRNHAQTLELARRSLEADPIEARDFSFLDLSFDSKRMEEARRMIRKFRDAFDRRFAPGEKDSVYKLSVNLIPLTKKEESP